MIFSKKVNIIHLIVAITVVFVCCGLAFRINKAYPKAVIVTNAEDNSVISLGCKITALDKKIYEIEDFVADYPDNNQYKYLLNGKYDISNHRIVVFKVNIENMTNENLRFNLPYEAVAEAFPSAWHNGLPLVSGDSRLKAHENRDFVVCSLYSNLLVYDDDMKNMPNNQFQLVFSYYPEKIVLKF